MHEEWMNGDWHTLDANDLEIKFEEALKTINQVFRFFRDRESLKDIFEIAQNMKAQIDKFKPIVPIAVYLRKDGMADRHWKEISTKVGFEVYPSEEFSLSNLVDMGMVQHTTVCEDVGERAAKEYHIEKSLRKMKLDWEQQTFKTPDFKKSGTNTISAFDEAVNLLDEHIVTAQAMTFSPFNGPFKEEIEEWATKLLLVSDTLEAWVQTQSHWVYLQPVFDSPDIQKQLQAECKRFKGVDIKWRTVMQAVIQDP
jgi:dynein heavy chain